MNQKYQSKPRYRSILFDAAALRRNLGLSQGDFWGKIGMCQSGGARCESAGLVTQPVMKLIRLQYIEGVDVDLTGKSGIVEAKLKGEK